ncbi:head-tail adaptor protein [Yoonia sp. MH D7]
MSRPQLNRHLKLEDLTRVPDGAGGFSEDWAELGFHWAEIKAGTGREGSGPAVSVSRVAYRITVRAAPSSSDARPKAGQRFRGQGRVYAITAVTEAAAGERYLACYLQGPFQITSIEYAGSHNGEATYELSLASAGELTFTAAL